MVNFIGTVPDVCALLEIPNAHVHLYDKAPRAGRKLGHVTVLAEEASERDALLAKVRQAVESENSSSPQPRLSPLV
jgi:5-(carboxyamino)imidazole ribonucleotide synthase